MVDGQLVFTLADPDGEARLTAARGRVFADLSTSTRPDRAGAGRPPGPPNGSPPATAAAPPPWSSYRPAPAGSRGRSPSSGPRAPSGGLGLTDGLYYLDATTGDLIEVRPANAQATRPSR